MRPLHAYLAGTATWFISHGIQTVLFAWLVTMSLREPADKVGLAQMMNLLPAMFLLLIGGSLADLYGPRRILLIAQTAAALPPLMLLGLLATNSLDFNTLLLYAVLMGTVQAILTPARDGLLNQVAEGRIQRTVILASMTQFGVQVLGFATAALTDQLGATTVLGIQVVALLVGALFYRQIPVPPPAAGAVFQSFWPSLVEGFRVVVRSRAMRPVLAVNCAMGLFFMGSYVVTIPLLVRENYAGTAAELAIVNACNATGLLVTIIALFRFGDVQRKGRALVVAHVIGALCLCTASLNVGFPILAISMMAWGACGGVAMSMSRTIMQELAPDNARSRVMAFFSLSFMGAGPLGALLSGFLADQFGAQRALVTSALAMGVVVSAVSLTTSIWREQPGQAETS